MESGPLPKRARVNAFSGSTCAVLMLGSGCAEPAAPKLAPTTMKRPRDEQEIVDGILGLLRCVRTEETEPDGIRLSELLCGSYAPKPGLIMPVRCLDSTFISFNCHAKAAIGWKGFPYAQELPVYRTSPMHNALGQLRMFSLGACKIADELARLTLELGIVMQLELKIDAVLDGGRMDQPSKKYFEPGGAETEAEAVREILCFCETCILPAICRGCWDLSLMECDDGHESVYLKHAIVQYLKTELEEAVIADGVCGQRKLNLCHELLRFSLTLRGYSKESASWLDYLIGMTRLPCAMALHPRLGAAAPISCLGSDLLYTVLCFIDQ